MVEHKKVLIAIVVVAVLRLMIIIICAVQIWFHHSVLIAIIFLTESVTLHFRVLGNFFSKIKPVYPGARL